MEQLERINIDLKSRLDETVQLYEQSQRDLRTKVSELQRTVHELDKTRELKDALARENKKLAGTYIIIKLLIEDKIVHYRPHKEKGKNFENKPFLKIFHWS